MHTRIIYPPSKPLLSSAFTALALSLSLSLSRCSKKRFSSSSFLNLNSQFNVQKMSCNGCRVLRKGCSENCMLRQCLQWIDNSQAQAHATVFVAKFFGRACLMSFISSVPERQRPALFQSLLFEAVGRTVNPVNGVVGLLWTGNWNVCQSAVETVLQGGELRALPEFLGEQVSMPESDVNASEAHGKQLCVSPLDLDLCLTAGNYNLHTRMEVRKRSPSEESETTTLGSDFSGGDCVTEGSGEREILRLFV